MQLKLFADSANINSKQLSYLIDTYSKSTLVKNMNIADKYYLGRHDILDKIRSYYVDGQSQTNSVVSNIKLPNPFLAILIDQKVSKIAGKAITVSVSGANNKKKPDLKADSFQEFLLKQLGTNFDDKMMDWLTGTSKHSVEWMHFYVDLKGQLKYLVIPSQQFIPIYDMEYENELIGGIRFYLFDYVNEKGETKKLYKLEHWTKEDVTYYTQIEDGTFVLDYFYVTNPMPHWFVANDTLQTKEPHGWGKVPFVGLQNNSKGQNDLETIKALIDVYDTVSSGWADDVEDFAEQVLVVKNLAVKDREFYAGMKEIDVFMNNLKKSKIITVDGADGDVKNIKAEIPVEAKERLLKLVRDAIFYFGEGVDVTSDKFGNSPSGVALQHLYALLDMKCNRSVLKLKTSLQEFFWFVATYINEATRNNFDPYLITYKLNQSMIFNQKEIIDGIKETDWLSQKTRIELDPRVEDLDEEIARLEEEKENQTEKKPDSTDIKDDSKVDDEEMK
jgi:SPP1 family phage portal protein